MVRFLHTSDWQLGMKALQAGTAAPRVREARFAAVIRVARVAKEHNVQFVLVAGDTFEDHDVDDLVVKRTVDALNQFAPLPVYIITGNHDPTIGGGVWDRASWKQVGSHVHLVREAGEIEPTLGVALFACPLKQKASTVDPTGWIPVRAGSDDRIRIGLAHGALDMLPDGTSNFPIAATRAETAGLDYLALGDWHGMLVNSKTAYSGTIEPTKFGESDPGNVLIVDIAAAGASPTITPVPVASLRWSIHEAEILDVTDVQALEREVRGLGKMGACLLRVRVRFAPDVTREAIDAASLLRAQVISEAMSCDWPEVDAPLPREVFALPSGALAEADALLQQVLAAQIPDGIGRSLAASPPEVVAEARRILHRVGRRSA